jgi:hypothetical protein
MGFVIWDTVLRRPAINTIYTQAKWADRLASRMNKAVERPVLWPFRYVAMELEMIL